MNSPSAVSDAHQDKVAAEDVGVVQGHLPVRSPSIDNKAAAPPTPPSLSGRDATEQNGDWNGSSGLDPNTTQNESEAETEILSGVEDSTETAIKHESDHEAHTPRSTTDTRKPLNSLHSVVERAIDEDSDGGGKPRHAPASSSPPPPPRVVAKSHTEPESLSARTLSPDKPKPVGRPRADSSRKRKERDEQPFRNIEPPRQKTKISSTRKEMAAPTHRRSTSSQSIQPEQKAWRHSDSSSEASEAFSSPQPTIPTLLPTQSRAKRSTHRSLTSPAKVITHKKNVDRFGATRLARECEKGDLDAVKLAYEQAPEELDQGDNAGIAPLQKAALNGNIDVVEFLIEKGCKIDCQSNDRDTPLIDAVENGHLEVVRVLLAHGVNPHRQNKEGKRAVDVLKNDTEDAEEIEAELRKAMREHASDVDDGTTSPILSRDTAQHAPGRPDLLYVESNTKNLRTYSGKGDAVAVDHFLSSIEPDNASAIAAAQGGHEMVLNLLLAAASAKLEKDPDPAEHSDNTPLLAAIGRGHLNVLRLLLNQDNFNPTRRTTDHRTYYEVAEERRGPKWQAEVELLKERYDAYMQRQDQRKKRGRPPASSNTGQSRAKVARKSSPHTGEPSSSPVTHTRKRSSYSSSDPIRPTTEELPKHRSRLVSGRELSTRREKQRRRRVVSEETSASESDGSSPGVRTGNKKPKTERGVKEPIMATSSSPAPEQSSSKAPAEFNAPYQPAIDESTDGKFNAQSAAALADLSRQNREREELLRVEKLRAEEAERQRQEQEDRQHAEKLAAEEARRLKEEEEMRQRERAARLDTLPPALKRACLLGRERPLHFSGEECGISVSFLPIYSTDLWQIDPGCDPARREEQWMLSFQAVGILGLPELDLTLSPVTAGWDRKDVTTRQRERVLTYVDVGKLAQAPYRFPMPCWPEYDGAKIAQTMRDTEQKLLAMEPLYWIPFDEFMHTIQSEPQFEYLRNLAIARERCQRCHVSDMPMPKRSLLDRVREVNGVKALPA